MNENVWIPNIISLKFVPKGPINNIPSLVQIMAWRRPGDKPLSEPIVVSLLTHICVTQPQWVKQWQGKSTSHDAHIPHEPSMGYANTAQTHQSMDNARETYRVAKVCPTLSRTWTMSKDPGWRSRWVTTPTRPKLRPPVIMHMLPARYKQLVTHWKWLPFCKHN